MALILSFTPGPAWLSLSINETLERDKSAWPGLGKPTVQKRRGAGPAGNHCSASFGNCWFNQWQGVTPGSAMVATEKE
jgi:hypothetical protein